jgi:hypothetical protein
VGKARTTRADPNLRLICVVAAWCNRAVRVGAVLPDTTLVAPGVVGDFTQAVEDLGYDFITAWEAQRRMPPRQSVPRGTQEMERQVTRSTQYLHPTGRVAAGRRE